VTFFANQEVASHNNFYSPSWQRYVIYPSVLVDLNVDKTLIPYIKVDIDGNPGVNCKALDGFRVGAFLGGSRIVDGP
jgi:hypothetical protein